MSPSDFGVFRAALRARALPPNTLALVHAEPGHLAVLLSVPATGQGLSPAHPWVRAQLSRLERVLGQPDVFQASAGARWLDPAHYAAGGHPGGAIYGAAYAPWRGGPLHPQPYRLGPGLWQVGTGVHPGGGLPAIFGGALIVDQLMREAGL